MQVCDASISVRLAESHRNPKWASAMDHSVELVGRCTVVVTLTEMQACYAGDRFEGPAPAAQEAAAAREWRQQRRVAPLQIARLLSNIPNLTEVRVIGSLLMLLCPDHSNPSPGKTQIIYSLMTRNRLLTE